jgi:RNA polymerase sigma-70 factor, ECF subfamily
MMLQAGSKEGYNGCVADPHETLPQGPTDAELMQRIGTGDMNALATIVRRHQDRIRRTAYRVLGRWDTTDDVAQETFLRLFKSASRYAPTAAFNTWLHRIVVNLCLDALKRRKAKSPDSPELVTIARDPDLLVEQERIEAIRRELDQLPERQRIAVALHRFEGMGHKEIATTTGWSESAVESLLVRAYARLRERLKEWAQS